MRFLRSLFGKSSNEIKIGDLVEQYRHYEYDENKAAILKLGPSSEDAGTKWRFRGFGKYKHDYKLESSTIEQLKQHGDFDELVELLELDEGLDEEPVVELELVEGIFRHSAPFQESELPKNDSERLEMLLRDPEEIVELPGYIRRITSALGYRRSFPNKSLLQQFFDEWRKVS